ncbi:MAG: hypothetical protein Q9168_003406 [Polycauliona sp. 1 TL-2023]
MQSDPRYRELPPLPQDNNTRIRLEPSPDHVVRSQPDNQKDNTLAPHCQRPPIETSSPLPETKAPSPPTRDLDSQDKPTLKSRTSLFGNFGRKRKDPLTSSADTTRNPEIAVLSQHSSSTAQAKRDPIGASIQRPSNHRARTAVSILTPSAWKRLSLTGSTSTGDTTSVFGDHPAEYSPRSSHTNQDAKSFVSSNTSRTSEDTQPKSISLKLPIAPSTITVITANQEDPSATDLLPSEANNYSGFCKGAWRLQIGDDKKALQERQRPGSMYNAVRFWQCKHCKFEGRLIQKPDKKKTKDYDQQVMVAEGIQFRWLFLFKCHVECKDDANPNPNPDNPLSTSFANANPNNPLRARFGCMFCCAEGRGTPVFKGAQALMEHSQEHRIRLPAGEVLYRMNAYVGEEAPTGADFDINLDAKEGLTI